MPIVLLITLQASAEGQRRRAETPAFVIGAAGGSENEVFALNGGVVVDRVGGVIVLDRSAP
ncbi:MAG: hypothetical protein L0271_08615 [Gemmatimonadetes bacterium]|nr:hypothetical protein [Gemmatimonadota bacterium]